MGLTLLFTCNATQASLVTYVVTQGAGVVEDWEDPANWSALTSLSPTAATGIPGSTDVSGNAAPQNTIEANIVINNARGMILDSDANSYLATGNTLNRVAVGNQLPGAGADGVSSLELTSNASLVLTNFFFVGANGRAGNFIFNDGASFSAGGNAIVGSNLADAESSIFTLALGSTGLTNTVDFTGNLNIREDEIDQQLVIDASSYTGGVSTFDLITFGSLTGMFSDVSVTGLDPSLSATVGFDSDSYFITIVPEPSGLVLTITFLSICALFRRKRISAS